MRSDKRRIKLTKRNVKKITLILCLVLVIGLAIGGTIAFLTATSGNVTNKFTPGVVTCAVDEKFENNVKSDVRIQNTGNVPAYIRATVVVNYVNADGQVCALHTAQTITMPESTKWTQSSDGFWYYADPVDPQAYTEILIKTVSPEAQADGCTLQVNIIASAIQAEGTGATTNGPDAWGIVPSGN